MKIRMHDGRVFYGSAKQIVQGMLSMSFIPLNFPSYLNWVRGATGMPAFEKTTIDDRCEELLAHLLKTKHAVQINEQNVEVCPYCGLLAHENEGTPCPERRPK